MTICRGTRGGCTKFNSFENFFSVKKLCYGFMLHNPAAVQWGTSAMEIAYLILLSALFAAGVGCGYYIRDRISRKRRERHLRAKRYVNIRRSDVERARRAFEFSRQSDASARND
jgi:hypothetical protein